MAKVENLERIRKIDEELKACEAYIAHIKRGNSVFKLKIVEKTRDKMKLLQDELADL